MEFQIAESMCDIGHYLPIAQVADQAGFGSFALGDSILYPESAVGSYPYTADGKRDFLRLAIAALRTPRISVFKLFESSTGIYALNALQVLRDPAWVERLTSSMTSVEAMGLSPHVGKVFPATDVAAAHAFLETKQATGKVLLAWN